MLDDLKVTTYADDIVVESSANVCANGTDGVGVPPGGLPTQVLTKRSTVDFDTEWTTPPEAIAERVISPWKYVLLGYSHDAALDAVIAELSDGSGVIDLQGYNWSFLLQHTINADNITVLAYGSIITLSYPSGPAFIFGDDVSQKEEQHIKGGRWIHSMAVSQPMFRTRWVRSLHFNGMRCDNVFKFMELGSVADGISHPSYILKMYDCEIIHRTTAEASNFIHVLNSPGWIELWNVHVEGGTVAGSGALTGFSAGVAGILWDAANPQTRFDYMAISSGMIRGFDYNLHAPSDRVVNVELGDALRIENSGTAGIKLGDAAINGQGCEGWDINCQFGGINLGKHIWFVANNATISNIVINASTTQGIGEGLLVEEIGTGSVTGLSVVSLVGKDWVPATVGTAFIHLGAGDINATIATVKVRTKAGHPITPNYIVYNDTPVSAEVWIDGSDVRYENGAPGIALVYDPNTGNDYVLTPDNFNAAGDGITNDAAAMSALFASAKRIYIPAGTYLMDDISISAPRDVVCDAGAILKKRAAGAASSRLIQFLPGSEGSTWFGGTIDGNTALHAAYTSSGLYDGWFGMVSRAIDITIQSVTFKNWVERPFWIAGDYNVFKNNRTEDCGGAPIFGWRCFGNNRLPSRPAVEGAYSQDVDGLEMLRPDNNGKTGVYQHAIDFHAPKAGSYVNMLVLHQGGATALPSAWISGYTMELAEDCVVENWVYENPTSEVCQHLAFSFVGCTGTNPKGLRSRGIAGQHFEWNGGDFTLTDFIFDGQYRATTAVPAGAAGSVGLTIYAGVYGEERVAKSLASTHQARFVDGLITGVTYGGFLRCQSGALTRVQAIGAITDGMSIITEKMDDDFPGAVIPVSGDWALDNCDFSHAGRIGLGITAGGNVSVTNSRLKNNGQDTTAAVDSRVGLSAAAGDVLAVTNCDISDDQTWTLIKRVSYEPQSSDASNQIHVLMSPPERIERGQWVKLLGVLAGPADLTAKIVAFDSNDRVTLQCTAPVTLVATGNTVNLTGTWTGSGTTLIGAGSTANEITGQVWITNGIEWRRVIKVVNSAQIIINAAFTIPLAASVLARLTVDISGIPSQSKGLRIFGAVNAILLSDNIYSGNTVMPMQLSDTSKCIFGCEYFRDVSLNPTFAISNFFSGIGAGHKVIGVSTNVDVALSGNGVTSWAALITNAGGTTLETLGTGLSIAKNTKLNMNAAGPAMSGSGNLIRCAATPAVAPTAGQITMRAAFRVEMPMPLVPSAP